MTGPIGTHARAYKAAVQAGTSKEGIVKAGGLFTLNLDVALDAYLETREDLIYLTPKEMRWIHSNASGTIVVEELSQIERNEISKKLEHSFDL